MTAFLQNFRAVVRLSLFLLWTALLLLVFVVAIPLGARFFIARQWHKGCLFIFGVRVTIKGTMSKESPLLYVANHVSYLDIIALGSLLKASFVSKAEVRQWPMFGWLSTLQNTVFINRRSREIKVQLAQLSERVLNKENLIIFPEGTSTDGKTVVPFKSSLFAICDLHPELTVQPVGLKYLDKKGLPLTDQERDQYAFYADFPFGEHLWGMLKGHGVSVELHFSSVINCNQFEHQAVSQSANRKELANKAYQQVLSAVSQ